MARLFAGTSGFAYPSWKPEFYPPKCAAKDFLSCYSKRLNSVEIVYTFRRRPSETTLENWIQATPPEFVFAPKAHQQITHFLKLKEAGPATVAYLQSLVTLEAAKRLGPVLFQLPPQLHFDLPLLQDFLGLLPRAMRFAFEFRHESWFCDPVYQLLEKHQTALCLAESETLQVPEIITASFVYYRLRKPEYSAEDRQAILAKARKLLEGGKDVFVFFKHEETPAGALYAEELLHAVAAR